MPRPIIGNFVRRLREQKKLTQDELAARTGITYQYLSGLGERTREFFHRHPRIAWQGAGLFAPATCGGRVCQSIGHFDRSKPNPDYFRPQVPLPPGLKIVSPAARDERNPADCLAD